MGSGIRISCNSCGKSGNILLGQGMLNRETCIRIKNAALSGRFGKKVAAMVKSNRGGTFDSETVIYICDSCGNWNTSMVLDYYISADSEMVEPETDDGENIYILFSDEESSIDGAYCLRDRNNYKRIYERRHRCSKCHNNMRTADLDMDVLKCPRCGEKLEIAMNAILWD